MSSFLPFCVPRFRDVDVYWWDDRVEKYRPVSLDDVVSHKDITGTSMSFGNVSWLNYYMQFPESFLLMNHS